MARKAVIIGTGISGILIGLFLKLAETGKDIDSIEVLNRRIDMAAFAINQKLKHAEDMVI
jgi:cation diffusion facilitator CzcD-associated flavoprotein CzcO